MIKPCAQLWCTHIPRLLHLCVGVCVCLTCRVESRLRNSPRVFINTLVSGSERSRKSCSVPSTLNISTLTFWSAWKAIFYKNTHTEAHTLQQCAVFTKPVCKVALNTAILTMRAQMPLTLSAGLSFCVKLHSKSMTPDSRIGCAHWTQHFQTNKQNVRLRHCDTPE